MSGDDIFRKVNHLQFNPGACFFTRKSNDEFYIDTGIQLIDIDANEHIYISKAALDRMNKVAGYPSTKEYGDLRQQLQELYLEINRLREKYEHAEELSEEDVYRIADYIGDRIANPTRTRSNDLDEVADKFDDVADRLAHAFDERSERAPSFPSRSAKSSSE